VLAGQHVPPRWDPAGAARRRPFSFGSGALAATEGYFCLRLSCEPAAMEQQQQNTGAYVHWSILICGWIIIDRFAQIFF
jgi:hypothetical protein